MHIAQAKQHGFIQFDVMLDMKTWVFLGQFLQRAGQLLLMPTADWLHAQAKHSFRQSQRHQVPVIFIVAVVQDIAVVDIVDFRNRADIARDPFVDLNMLGAK